jgi:hypothetical protein
MRKPFFFAILLLLIAFTALTTALAGSRDDGEPRTALERLVAENQDFALLEPGELRDGLPVPAWLRVLWRREHPDGPYPLILKEVHEWMLAHPDLVPPEEPEPDSEVAAIPAPANRKARAGANRRVSGSWPTPINESDVQIDRWNPKRILVASNDIKGSGRLAVYYSKDGGATWTAPRVVGSTWGILSGYAGTFFPTWTDRRGSSPEEIWTATVRDIR